MIVVKKYSNRRLYDTEQSGYITLEQLAEKIRAGHDVKVVDATSGADLTQATLAQIIIDGRGAAKLLPVELLTQLIRLQDDFLTEFMGKYLSYALEMYLATKRGVQATAPLYPYAPMPLNPADAFSRMMSGQVPWQPPVAPPPVGPEPPVSPAPEPTAPANDRAEFEQLRRELEELKQAIRKGDG